jgi:hypothetical protein
MKHAPSTLFAILLITAEAASGAVVTQDYISNLNLSVNVVPEPTSMLSTLAFVCSGLMLRRRCKIFVWI